MTKTKLFVTLMCVTAISFNAFANKKLAKKQIVKIEAESTTSELGKWIKIDSTTPNYVTDASGNMHLEFTGNTINGGSADSPLSYTFTAPANGTYQLAVRCNKRLDGAPGDKCNDGWVKVEGNFESGNDIPADDLKKNEKLFGGTEKGWGWATQLDWQGHIKRNALYNLKKGETYTITISGRSIRWNIDYILFYNTTKYPTLTDMLKVVNPKMAAATPATKWNLAVPGFSPAYFEAGRGSIAINTLEQPTDKWGAATKKFEGKPGTYSIKFTSLQETDGECSYKLKIDGKEVLSFTNPRIHGTDSKDYSPYTQTVNNVKLKKGSLIQVEFLPNSNKLIKEGQGFAFARARWLDLEFTK